MKISQNGKSTQSCEESLKVRDSHPFTYEQEVASKRLSDYIEELNTALLASGVHHELLQAVTVSECGIQDILRIRRLHEQTEEPSS